MMPATLRAQRLIRRPFALRDPEVSVAYHAGPRTGGAGGPRQRSDVAERFHATAGRWALRGSGRDAIAPGGGAGIAFGPAGPMQIDGDNAPEMTWTLRDGAREGRGHVTDACRAVFARCAGAPLITRLAPDDLRSASDPDAPPSEWSPGRAIWRAPA
jgi:hypothetical protein